MHDFEYISSMCVHMDLDSWMHHDAIAGSMHDIMCTDPPSNTNQIRPLPAPDLKCRQQQIGNVHKFDSLLLSYLVSIGILMGIELFQVRLEVSVWSEMKDHPAKTTMNYHRAVIFARAKELKRRLSRFQVQGSKWGLLQSAVGRTIWWN